jgi:hypothetical protein
VQRRGSARRLVLCEQVGERPHNTNLTPLVTGPMIELTERHAKIRNNQ